MAQLPRESAFQLLGLITEPNEYGVYPKGACSLAQNVLFRSPGLCTTARDHGSVSGFGAVNSTIHRIVPTESGNYYALVRDTASTANSWVPYWSGGNVGTFATSYNFKLSVADNTGLFSATGYISPMKMRQRLFVNTIDRGVMVCDTVNPTTAGERFFRVTGLPQPNILLQSISSTNAGAIPNTVIAGYAVVFRRVISDGYEIVSVPSAIRTYYNGGGVTRDITLSVHWRDTDAMQVGDYVELYKTNGIASATYNTPVGQTLRLVASLQLTSAQVAARSANITDKQPLTSPLYETVGRELYTNPFQEGAAGAYRQPPSCRAMATFQGFAFYGNITDRAIANLTVPAGCGVTHNAAGTATAADTAFFRVNGIGERRGAGTITAGSAVITGVSATDILGITVGQTWTGSFSIFSSSAVVSSVGATTITMSINASNPAAEFRISDVIEVNGLNRTIQDPGGFYFQIVTNGISGVGAYAYELNFNTAVAIEQQNTYSGAGFNMTIEPGRAAYGFDTITVRGTNGQNYSPPIPLLTAGVQTFTKTQRKNVLQWSNQDTPEHCPAAGGPYGISNTTVGSAEIVAMHATRDALWIWCTDGLYRLTGLGGDWRVDLVDPQLIICAPGAAITMHDTCYAYTNRGFVAVNDMGIQEISQGAINDILPGPSYQETNKYQLHKDETNDEVYLVIQGASLGTDSTVYCYNTRTKKWSTLVFGDQRITTMGYMQYPTTPGQEGYPLICTSPQGGAAPLVYHWPGTGTPLQPRVLLQPFYADDPFVVKQWIECSWIFEADDLGNSIVSFFNNTTDYGTATLVSNGIDSRVTFGVPRDRAIRPSIKPGFRCAAPLTNLAIKGVSLKYKPLTTQSQEKS